MSNTNKPKFRPVLSEDDLRTLYSSCPEGSTKQYLRVFLTKIGVGLVTPGYIPTGTRENHLTNSLGFSQDELQNIRVGTSPNETADAPDLTDCGVLLDLYQSDPLSLTVAQLERVHSHRYAENLMSPEEEKDYEQKLGL